MYYECTASATTNVLPVLLVYYYYPCTITDGTLLQQCFYSTFMRTTINETEHLPPHRSTTDRTRTRHNTMMKTKKTHRNQEQTNLLHILGMQIAPASQGHAQKYIIDIDVFWCSDLGASSRVCIFSPNTRRHRYLLCII